MESITVLIKTVLVKLMEREDFVDVLQMAATFLLMAAAMRLSLWVFGWDAYVKDAGFYFIQSLGGAIIIMLAFSLFGRRPGIWLKLYFFVLMIAAVAGTCYRFATGTLAPIFQ